MSNNNKIRTITFTLFMINAVVISFFPVYFDYKGFSKMEIGILYSVGPLIGIVSNLFWGAASDKFQTMKKVLIVVFIGQALFGGLLFGADTITMVLVLTAAFYFFQNPNIALNDSQILLAVSQGGGSYPSFRVWGSIGFGFSALGFGFITKQFGPAAIPYLCLGSIILSLLVAFSLKDVRTSYKKMDFSGLIKIFTRKPFLLFLFFIMILSIAHRINDGFLTLSLRQMGASDTIVGWSWLISAFSEIPVFFLMAKYGHRYKELPLLVVSSLVYTVRFLLVGLSNDPMWIVLLQALHSFSFGIFLITAIRYIQQSVPDEFRASGQAVFAVVWGGFAGLLSGIVGGWIFEQYGPHSVYLIASALAFTAGIGFFATHLWENEQNNEMEKMV